MDVDVAIKGGLVVTAHGAVRAGVGIRNGRICAIVDEPRDLRAHDEEVDATRLVVLPGAIEPHCHFWDPGPTDREDWETGTRSAAAGGITTVIEMPLSDPPTVDGAAFRLKQARAGAQALVDYALWGGIIPASWEDLPGRLQAMDELGAVAYKAFMCWSATDYPPVDDGLLLATMRELAQRRGMIGLHAENDAIIKRSEELLHREGRTDPLAHVESRPEIAEYEAIHRALALAAAAAVDLYIVHMSIADGARLLQQAKATGQRVWVETAPQYLTLDCRALSARGPFAKCSPPLRAADNTEQLWQYVLNGTIDTIGSDHAPFTVLEKEAGSDDIWQAPNGLTGIQTMLPLMLSEGYHRRGLSLQRIAELCSTNVARIFRLYPRKGAIGVGSDADLTLVDLDREWIIDDEGLLYKNRWSPYRGMTVRGAVAQTIVRGRTVYRDGTVLGQPGYGHQVLPLPASAAAAGR